MLRFERAPEDRRELRQPLLGTALAAVLQQVAERLQRRRRFSGESAWPG
jgi:hypothetical protein